MKVPYFYNRFTFFSDPETNVFFNQLYTLLCNSFTVKEVEDDLMVDGALAIVLQGGEARLKGIEICSSSDKINKQLCATIYSLPVSNVQISVTGIFFKANSKLIKINFLTKRPTSVIIDGITVRNSREIKL